MKIAVIIPCLNEEASVGAVVQRCRRKLPGAAVYVFDNASDDATAERARRAGARVIHSPLRGKGNVLRHALRMVDADYIVITDGDGTYPIEEAPRMLQLARDNGYEMVMGARLELGRPDGFPRFHYWGNRVFNALARWLFRYPVRDMMTGLRVISGAFARRIGLVSHGFEVETEMTLRAIAQDMPFLEVDIPYVERARGSYSKLRTFRDGCVILGMMFRLWSQFHPLLFHFLLAAAAAGAGLWVHGGRFAAGLFLALGFYLHWRAEHERFQPRTLAAKKRAETTARKSA
jgi:glycosyltransferase involved in cell wall biosynthesis